jgi:coproporphyrinogen III oxidase
MSLPPMANWEYQYEAIAGSEEAETLEWLGKITSYLPSGNE